MFELVENVFCDVTEHVTAFEIDVTTVSTGVEGGSQLVYEDGLSGHCPQTRGVEVLVEDAPRIRQTHQSISHSVFCFYQVQHVLPVQVLR